ncbi:MAG: polysaccharide pyruvyl transferase family protein, partial [Alphaproteobacteria bacterium]
MRVLFLNGDAAIKPDLSGAHFPFPGAAAYFRSPGVNTGDAFVLDAILKQLRIAAAADIRFRDAARRELWPDDEPDLTVIRGSNYLGRSLDLGHVLPLVERLEGPVVAIGVGAQAPGYGPLDLPPGSVRFWRAVAARSVSIGVRGAYSAEVLERIGVRNVRVIGCPTLYRGLAPTLAIRRADPAAARIGLTLNRYLARDYTGSFVKTHRLQRALVRAVAHRPGSRLFAQGEREESVLGHLAPHDRPALARRILRR